MGMFEIITKISRSLASAAIVFALFSASIANAAVADLKNFSQNASSYMPKDPDARIVDAPRAAELAADFIAHRYAPWTSPDLSYLDLTLDALVSYQKQVVKKNFFTDGGRVFPKAEMQKIAANMAFDLSAAAPRPGVCLVDEDVRVIPCASALYTDADSAKGARGLLKQDVIQTSSIKPGEPLAVWAASRDSKWYLIATDAFAGWIPARSAAIVRPDAMSAIIASPHVVAVSDDIMVHPTGGEPVVVKMGALLPTKEGRPLLPIRNKTAFASFSTFDAPSASFADFPRPFTARAALAAMAEMAGEPYGWGGLNGHRDCSALTRDYFSLFGIWLPRNSADQAAKYKSASVSKLSRSAKEKKILSDAIPFATLLHMPGHIMLYVGEANGRAVVFHNMWGVRVKRDGRDARVVVGQAAFTSLRPGAEQKGVVADRLLIDRVGAIAYAGEAKEVK